MKKIFFLIVLFFLATDARIALAHQPNIVFTQKGDIQIGNPELSQAFYDELKGQPRYYFIKSGKDFMLYLNLLVPEAENRYGKYSANVFLVAGDKEENVLTLDAGAGDWVRYYEEFGRDYYLKGPEAEKQMPAGIYKIEVFSADNRGKYVLAVGKSEFFDAKSILNIIWQLPFLKISFFKSDVLQFFLTPFGVGLIATVGIFSVLIALIYYFIGVIRMAIRHRQAKTLLLTSDGMAMKKEIIKLLQKPAYDIEVAFITTAAKPLEDLSFVKKDWEIMQEIGFNVQEIDIEGKTERQVAELVRLKDIIFVEGGNVFYLLNAMRRCNFEKIIRKLLKEGKVYIGASAGTMVAGKTVQTALWKHDTERFGVKTLKGLNLAPFDFFVHYQPEDAEIIKKKMKSPRKRKRRLKILTDQQAILVQGKEVALIGEGEEITV